MWRERAERGQWPRAGGWEDQPLALLVQMDTLDLLARTVRYMARPDADWSRLTRLQRDLIHWLEGNADDGSDQS